MVEMPDIRLFKSAESHGNPFAKYDYMNVLPPVKALNEFLNICDMARKVKQKLPKHFLESERRCYLALKDNKSVHFTYDWENSPTDFWYTEVL